MLRHWKAMTLAVVFIGVGFYQAYLWATDYFVSRAEDRSTATLGLVVEAVDQAIGRFKPIPTLIASDPAFRQLLRHDSAADTSPFLNEKLRQIALSIDASEVYLLGLDGNTIATSNYRDEDSFLGRNFAFRPYFSKAVAGEIASFHALGTTSGERGFFFSAPVLDGVEIVGVMALKIQADAIEEEWQGLEQDILIVDDKGIIFMSSRDEFKFRALAPLSDTTRAAIARTQQFPLDQVVPLDLTADVLGPDTVRATIRMNAGEEAYLVESQPLTLAGWHGVVLTHLDTVQGQVARTLALGSFAGVAGLLAVLMILQRRANILQRIHLEQQQREILEVKVQERTADLNAANSNLKEEVAERRNAEERLRRSQKELIQAGKLAALGQMSAAISHEINQPLGAIKSYAANASAFLTRSQVDEAKSNVDIIVQMTDRISEISHHLRNFARQPGDKLREIDIPEVIEETISIVGPQLRSRYATVHFDRPDGAVLALGGRLRLQQVLVNIVNNALEAMSQIKQPVLEIAVEQTDDAVTISVRDYGPGLKQENLDHVFDAFYTTKSSGQGMGLGLSISQNIINDFGGALSVANHSDGGAVFKVMLRKPDLDDPGKAIT